MTSLNKTNAQGNWLASSIGWTGSCLGGWLVLLAGLLNVPVSHGSLGLKLCICGAVVAHFLIWWKGVRNGWARSEETDELWLRMVGQLWLTALTLFQVFSSLLLLGIVGMVFGENEGPNLFET